LTEQLVALCGFAFAAGCLDAIVGGGGLIQVPALFILMPDLPTATLLGTNKFASIWGTAAAAAQYMRRMPVEWRGTLPAALTALVFSYLGARAVTLLQPAVLRPLLLVLLIAVFVYTIRRKDFGQLHAPRLGHGAQILASLLTGAAIGFYDGFFGPGTGSFLIFAFVGIFGFSFLAASASAKIVNVITNFAAIVWFVRSGHVIYTLALPMALSNVAGSLVGTRLALRHGSGFVRVLFVVVVGALLLRYAWDIVPS